MVVSIRCFAALDMRSFCSVTEWSGVVARSPSMDCLNTLLYSTRHVKFLIGDRVTKGCIEVTVIELSRYTASQHSTNAV